MTPASENAGPTRVPRHGRRDVLADRARQRLERQVDVWLEEEAGGLTAAEFVAVVTSVFADTLGSWARHEMRTERDHDSDEGERAGRSVG